MQISDGSFTKNAQNAVVVYGVLLIQTHVWILIKNIKLMMATGKNLVSAFEIHVKRRKSAENVITPIKSKRLCSSQNQSHDLTSTPLKSSRSEKASLEDISVILKSTPSKSSNRSIANESSIEENSAKKENSRKAKKKSKFFITDSRPSSNSSLTKLSGTSGQIEFQENENQQEDETKSFIDSYDGQSSVDQISDVENSDVSMKLPSTKTSEMWIEKVKINGREKKLKKTSSNWSNIEEQLNIIRKGPISTSQVEKLLKTSENDNQPKKLKKKWEESLASADRSEQSGEFEVEDRQDSLKTTKTPRKSAKTHEKPSKIPGKMSKLAEKKSINDINPINDANDVFSWLLNPMMTSAFFENNWERTPLHIIRKQPNYYKNLLSTPQIDEILRENRILFTKNIDITTYTDGQRQTHNPDGRAEASVVWDYYLNGCSVRMLNPQTYIPRLHHLNATLQELFGCFVGANFYLTPPGTQGFAPHYDDIEAFILQIEGKKRWRLYKPRNPEEYLPRESSRNFEESEIGKPIRDVVLNAGDLLYFPRGTIHQATTLENHHSLHITLSVYQKNSWADLLEKLVPNALQTAIDKNSEFRAGLPLTILDRLEGESLRTAEENVKAMLHKVIDNIDISKAIDEMAKKHIHDFLPPVLSPLEAKCSIINGAERMVEDGVIVNRVEIDSETRIRLIRSHAVRLINEENVWRIYYSTENSNEYHEYELKYVEVDESHIGAIRAIISSYPNFVTVGELPIDDEDERISVIRDLWEKYIVVTEKPLATGVYNVNK